MVTYFFETVCAVFGVGFGTSLLFYCITTRRLLDNHTTHIAATKMEIHSPGFEHPRS